MSLATLFGRGGGSDDTGSDSDPDDPDVVLAPVSATGLNMMPTHTESDIHEPCIVESGHPISTIHGHGDAALEAPPISESVSGVDHTIDDVGDDDEAADDGSDDDDGGGSKHWKNDNYGRPIDRVWLQTLPEQVRHEPAYRSVYIFRQQPILYIICCSRHVFELGRVYPNSNPSAMRSHHMRYRQHDIAICRMPV